MGKKTYINRWMRTKNSETGGSAGSILKWAWGVLGQSLS